MSNYMGGARNFAKRRQDGFASGTPKPRYPRLKAFSSRGFTMNRSLDGKKQEIVHQIELSHAKNASFPSKTRKDASQQVTAQGRIDAVSPTSIQSYTSAVSKRQRDTSSKLLETLSGTDAETRRAKFSRILQHKNLLELAPLQSNGPLKPPDRAVQKRSLVENEVVTPDRTYKKRRFDPSSATTSADGSSSLSFMQTLYQSSLHSQIPAFDFFPSNDITAKPTLSTMEDLLAELEEHDDILSFPPTPSNEDPEDSQTTLDTNKMDGVNETMSDMYDSTYAFRDLSPEIAECTAESLFSLRDYSVISSGGLWGELSPTWSPDQQMLTPNDQELPSPRKVISNLMGYDSGYDSDSPAEELNYSRLPNDRSGVGVPLKRWICDNVEPERHNVFMELNPDYESDNEEGSLIEHDWLRLPYENHVTFEHVATPPTPNSTSSSWHELHLNHDISSHNGSIAEAQCRVQEEEPPVDWLKVNAERFIENLSNQGIEELERKAEVTEYSDEEFPVTKTQTREGSQMREGENVTFVLAPDLFG